MLNKFVYASTIVLCALTTRGLAVGALEEFENAWENPQYTHYRAPSADVNESLVRHSDPNNNNNAQTQRLTGTQLWDAEKKKAQAPQKYIPHVVIEGRISDELHSQDGEVTFMRSSQQRSWLDPTVIVPVLEEVHIFETLRKVIFLGKPVESSPESSQSQPLFHVEHSVEGTEEKPLSLWRIVMLTPDKKYIEAIKDRFEQTASSFATIFVQKYLEYDRK